MDYEALWHRASNAEALESVAPLTDKQVADAEARWKVRFPKAFVELLKVQNGGVIRHQDEDIEIFPLLPEQVDAPDSAVIMSLDDYAVRGWMLDESGLDSVRDELGDPERVLALNSDGHTCYALNFNQARHGNPSLYYLDFECSVIEEIAPSFDAWLAKLTGAGDTSDPEMEDPDEAVGAEAPPAAKAPIQNQGCPPAPEADTADPETVFAAVSKSVDELTAVMMAITDAKSAKALERQLHEKAEAYKAAEQRVLRCISSGRMKEKQIGELSIRYQFPQGRVYWALMQLRSRGPDVYRTIRPTIKLLEDL